MPKNQKLTKKEQEYEDMIQDSFIAIKLFIPTTIICLFLAIKERFFQHPDIVSRTNIMYYIILCIFIIFYTALWQKDQKQSKKPKTI